LELKSKINEVSEEGNEDKEDQMGNKKIRVDTFKQNNNRRVNPIQGMESES